MTDQDMRALEVWQSSCEGAAERRLHDLTNAVDDLTTIAQSRQGFHVLAGNRTELIAAMRKLHDLVLETQPAEKVA